MAAVEFNFGDVISALGTTRALPTRPALDADAPYTTVERMAVAFVVALRTAGLPVALGSVITFTEALAAVGLESRQYVYWAGRAVLVRRPEDIALYDRAFAAFWLARMSGAEPGPEMVQHITLALDAGDDDDPPAEAEGDDSPTDETLAVRWSGHEVLRDKDFAEYSSEEFAEAREVMASLRLNGSPRRCRRMVPATGSRMRGRPDLRRTVRQALRSDGVPIRRYFLTESLKPRRIVLLCDVSGSMESYARALVRFCQAAVVGRGRVEAFALGTRLTRITRELSSRNPDEALAKAAKRVLDWSGGTRLGEGMRAFNDQWGVRGMARSAIVVILSDGWDRGEPELLAEQMARLHRVAFRVIWVNPLKAAPGYAPLARGMAAALPYVDAFVEGHSLASLQELAAVIAA